MVEQQEINVEALRRQIADGNFAMRPHAMQHAVKEEFTQADVVHVALNGLLVESYPARCRGLFYANIRIEGITVPLHVVCEHRHSEASVDIVTAYVPAKAEWMTPTRRRKKRP